MDHRYWGGEVKGGVRLKRYILIFLAIGLVITLIPSTALAQYIQIISSETFFTQTDSDETDIPKDRIIKRIHELFPGKFTHIQDEDFQRERTVSHQGNGLQTHSIYFNHRLNNRDYESGSFTFVGDDLELKTFSYRPKNQIGAYYPPLVDREEAKEIAENFIADLHPYHNYRLLQSDVDSGKLTDPIQYHFNFNLFYLDVPVVGATISLTVRGDGEIIFYSRNEQAIKRYSYERQRSILNEEDVLEQIREQTELELIYVLDINDTDDPNVYLAYRPKKRIGGMHAITGKWYQNGSFKERLDNGESGYTYITQRPHEISDPITPQEARNIATKLLELPDRDLKLKINHIDEKDYDDSTIIRVHYTYERGNAAFGSSMEIDKETGDVLYYNRHWDFDLIEQEETGQRISEEEALDKAVAAFKEYAPSIAHKYVLPDNEYGYDPYTKSYFFKFQRMENEIPLVGDYVTISISALNGEILYLDTRNRYEGDLPPTINVVSVEEAIENYVDKLAVTLRYTLDYREEDPNQLYLVYTLDQPDDDEYFNAVTGEWTQFEGASVRDEADLDHPLITEEIRFLAESGILTIDEDFDPERSITKGEALEILIRSTTYYYDSYYAHEELKPTFKNIDPSHPLFYLVEYAVELGVLDDKQSTFDVDEVITKEELASWMIKMLHLETAARHGDIDQMNFTDADQINPDFKGHVALLAAYGVLTGNEQGQYQPKSEVTLNQMVEALFRFANVLITLEQL